jgi:hypothetical protein
VTVVHRRVSLGGCKDPFNSVPQLGESALRAE